MYFLNRYCPNSDGKWTIKCPAKKQFCRNSLRISTIVEIRQCCPTSSRISKHVEIQMAKFFLSEFHFTVLFDGTLGSIKWISEF
jgi:hypothetical protein